MRGNLLPRKAGLLFGLMISVWAVEVTARDISNPMEVGAAEVRLFGFKLYDARLLTPGGQGFDPRKPHALELRYARSFDRDSLLKATRKEMQRIEGRGAGISLTMERLSTCFKDVSSGDRFKATALTADRLVFSLNGTPTCDVTAPRLASRFLSIWLSDKARDPMLSRKLRGLAQ
ncbi:MAG: chalcone isomerase family protein [Pseudopelagicola sp.]|nr:chalcone isomerase family protein [Pseudopelagicola sp.]